MQVPVLTEEDNMLLEGNFDEEVLRALKLCEVDKAPGLDGFTMGCLVKCWEVVSRTSWILFKTSSKEF